jgi:nitrite reductase/ring-hydroxylating ferredoxin subunit
MCPERKDLSTTAAFGFFIWYCPMCDGWRVNVLLDLWIQAMRETQDSQLSPSRRALLAGAGVTCAAMLAGCTTQDASSGGVTPAASGAPTSAGGSAPVATALAATFQVPDGGGKIIDAERIVITQPQSGSFKAFSAICTHEGCFVNKVSNGTINCPCHGSKFSIKDGSVVHGPATRPLPPIAINVEGTSIFLANVASL